MKCEKCGGTGIIKIEPAGCYCEGCDGQDTYGDFSCSRWEMSCSCSAGIKKQFPGAVVSSNNIVHEERGPEDTIYWWVSMTVGADMVGKKGTLIFLPDKKEQTK